MKFLFAPDSYKGSLSSMAMCRILEEQARRFFPQVETVSIPIADGGEGTAEALVASCGGQLCRLDVVGPDGHLVSANYALLENGQAAVVEMAQASGLPLMKKPDPMSATSFGTGMLMRHCLAAGVRRLYIGLGGSATNDGGMGMLTALGVRFVDAEGRDLTGSGAELKQIAAVSLADLMPEIGQAEIRVLADVTNPLLGPTGATMVYGPQKGATPGMLAALEEGMAHYADVVEQATGQSIRDLPGAGAAGGMGAALCGVLHGQMIPGMDMILRAAHFSERLNDVDLVVTGEGCLDGQSIRYGKACGVIAGLCAERGIPVLAIVGGIGPGGEELSQRGLNSAMTIVPGPISLAESMEKAADLYADAAARAFRLMAIGGKILHS